MSNHKPPSDKLVQSRASSSYDPYSSTILDLDTDDEKIIRRHALKQFYGSEGTAASSFLTEKNGKKGDKNLDSDRPPSPMTAASSIALEPEQHPSSSNKKPMSKPLPKPVLFIQDELQRRRHLSPKSRLVGFGCCCCCVVAILLAVIGIPVFYLVCLPRMVQSTIQSSQVHWDQILFEPPPSLSSNIMTSKRAESSIFSMKFDGKVEKAGFFPAVIEFPDPITVYWRKSELGQLTGLKVLEVTIGGRGTIQEDRTQLEIWDRDLFSGFAKNLTAASGTAQDVDWSISTRATVWIMGFIRIPNVELHKDVPIPGMNGLQDIKVASFDLPGDIPSNSTGNGGVLMAMSLFLNNPSPFGLALGAVTFDLMFQGTLIGQAITVSTETNTATLHGSGMSSSSPLMLEGSLYRQTNQTDLDNLSTLMSNYLAGKISNITARPVTRGSTDLSGGVTPDSWFYDDIMALTLNIPLQSPTTQNVLRDVQITDLGFVFSQASAFAPTIQSKSMSGAFKLPFNISTQVQSVRNTMALATSQGTLLGDLKELAPSVASSRAPGVIAFSLAPSRLTIVNEQAKADFEAFLVDLTSKAEVPFSITGLSNATMNTALGPLMLLNLPFNSAVSIKAFGLNSPGQMSDAVVFSNAIVSGGTEDHLIITGTASFMNPSALSVITDAGIMLMVLDRNTNQVLGELSVGSLNIVPGLNVIQTQFLFHPMDPNIRDMFLSQSLAGGSTGLGSYSTPSIPIRIIGSGSPFAPFAMGPPLAGSNPELEKALSQVALSGSIAGLKPSTLITWGQLTSTIGGAGSGLLTTLSFQFHNPFVTELVITGISSQIIWRGNLFGAVSDSASINSVPANGIASSSTSMPVQHPPGLDGLSMTGQFDTANPGVALGASAGALVAFDLDNVIQVRIGGPVGYAATVKYRQTVNLMTKVNVPPPAALEAPPPPPPPPPAIVAPSPPPPPPATVAPPAQKPAPTSVLSSAPVPAPAPIAGAAAVPVTDRTGSHPSTPPTSAPSPGSH
ncbi:hypothetical protein EMPS_03585 [Entomortierella parvispora]|uniref:Pre-rRNA processing protein n=1 Tax=Entomortierella parvispora TaxID=205924 RepID=A0A9P3H6X0_9FUNG|nr:hypothetical protein EMPS_03585 [Entomortierella parvispora]